jgi:peptidoglycan/xylan/chitin deacetylase (PgdA/CDA1 family)
MNGLTIKDTLRRFLSRRSSVVLTYHSVQRRSPPFPIWHHMSADCFEEQIDHLARHYRCISIPQLLTGMERGRLEPYSVAVTFDDGFANNLYVALPILERYRIPATCFVTTGVIGADRPLWPDQVACMLAVTPVSRIEFDGTQLPLRSASEKSTSFKKIVKAGKALASVDLGRFLETLASSMNVDIGMLPQHSIWDECRALNWAEIAELVGSGLVEVGAHTATHSVLSRLPEADARYEVSACKAKLESNRLAVRYFAYPYGGDADFGAEHRQMAIDSGYAAAFSASPGVVTVNSDRYRIPRLGIGGDTTAAQFRHALAGGLARQSISS